MKHAGGFASRWRALALAAAAWLLAGAASAAPAEAPPPDRAAMLERIESIRRWLAAPRDDKGEGRLSVGAARTLEVHQEADGSQSTQETPAEFQATAGCKTLEFLARHAAVLGSGKDTRAELNALLDRLRGVQSKRRDSLSFGALASDRFQRNYVTLTNAVCGDALLAARKVVEDPELLVMARGVGDYLLRLLELGDELASAQARRGGKTPVFGLFDRTTSAGQVQVTSSTWNLAAASFLNDLGRTTGDLVYRRAAQRIAAFQWPGVVQGHDYFSPAFDAQDKRVLPRWNLGYASKGSGLKHEFADGQWHRQGDIREPRSGTVGTDQIEYSLAALQRLRWDADALKKAYLGYRNLPTDLACLDPGVSFSGYFRIFEAGDARNANMGKYYDIVGAGILAELKREFFPADHRAAIRAILANTDDWAMLDCDLQPVWTRKGGERMAKRSTLVAATSGLALLDALAAVSAAPAPPASAAARR